MYSPWKSISLFSRRDDEGADLGFKEIAVPTPEMVCAQFSTSESVLGEQDQVTSQLR